MVDLIAKSPCAGLLPASVGSMKAEEITPSAMTLIAPYGSTAKSAAALKKLGLSYPSAGEVSTSGDARAIWFGHGSILLIGAPCPAIADAAITDQSDAWATVRISGPQVEDVMARLTPVDMRLNHYAVGSTCRTEVMHMSASVTRVAEDAFDIMVFRSMARTLVHDLKTAMTAVYQRQR